jgi:hypothetical protein
MALRGLGGGPPPVKLILKNKKLNHNIFAVVIGYNFVLKSIFHLVKVFC